MVSSAHCNSRSPLDTVFHSLKSCYPHSGLCQNKTLFEASFQTPQETGFQDFLLTILTCRSSLPLFVSPTRGWL